MVSFINTNYILCKINCKFRYSIVNYINKSINLQPAFKRYRSNNCSCIAFYMQNKDSEFLVLTISKSYTQNSIRLFTTNTIYIYICGFFVQESEIQFPPKNRCAIPCVIFLNTKKKQRQTTYVLTN